MRKEKWLLREIDSWQGLALIDAEAAQSLRNRYAPKKNANFLVILFSIIGAALIGAGIILIGAWNWERFPVALRVAVAFLPLVASHALAVYTVKAKYGSLAWRESVAVFSTAAVFAALAVVSQIFHLPGDYAVYVLTCGLLSLPMMYLLNAASPLIVYYWAILNWGALEPSAFSAPILFVLFALGALFVWLRRNEATPRPIYMAWATVAAGYALVLIMGIQLECDLLLVSLGYFALLLAAGGLPERLLPPLRIIGTLGGIVATAVLTYRDIWYYWSGTKMAAGGVVMIGVLLLASLFFAVVTLKRDRPRFWFIALLLFLCALRFLWAVFALDKGPFDFIFMLISNLAMLLVGVGFIVFGAKNAALLQMNTGMAAICALIVMRFFDIDMDFLWRGIVFLLLGTAFLLANRRILRARKRSEREDVA